MKETNVAFGKETFKAWKILKGLDRDDHAGNFGTVEILRKVESLEDFERGMFPGKSTISRRAKELELFAQDFVPYKCYMSTIGHRNIKFKYDNVLRNVLLALGLLDKAKTQPVEIAFTIDYAQVCSTTNRGHVLAGVKIIDRDTKIPGTDALMFAFDDDGEDGDCKVGVHSRELDTCIPLHFCVGKESLEVFREDFKEFFEFGNRVSRDGLVARTEDEATLVPFDVTFPMDMSAEQKCFNLGGACKSAKFFCIKCATELRKETYFWEKDSGHSCGSVYCVAGVGKRCRHMAVDDNSELERKSKKLEVLLGGGVASVGGEHIEEVVAGETLIRWDPSIANREKDSHHIDFLWTHTQIALRISFMKLVDSELELRGFALVDPVNGTPIFIRDKIIRLKKYLLDGAKVTTLRNSLERAVDKRDISISNGKGRTLYLAYVERGE